MQMIEKKGMHPCFRLLETLLLVIKICTGFITDVIWVNTKV